MIRSARLILLLATCSVVWAVNISEEEIKKKVTPARTIFLEYFSSNQKVPDLDTKIRHILYTVSIEEWEALATLLNKYHDDDVKSEIKTKFIVMQRKRNKELDDLVHGKKIDT